ncbi:MAG: T9SS type A sorting domain-containing protein, partial [Bacteroidales bacterium]|nr:T9SS type A sorting domain-containing protein [Bacteroidales bacterium]
SIQKENEILVYPNPTKDEVYIRAKGEQINSYSLCNISGQLLLKSEKIKTKSEKLNLSAFTKGVYILKVVTDKNVYSRKVIKR